MQVLLDSNIYKRDLTLEKAKFQLLFNQASAGQFQLALPEVVSRETTALYRREIEDRHRDLRRAAERLKSLQVSADHSETLDSEAASAEFRKKLEAKVLGPNELTLPIPEVSHDKLVDQAIDKRRPFNGKGGGYRDALIWRNVVELANTGETVALVTDNYKDFAEHDGETLHVDLLRELEEVGATKESVLLYRDLDAFLDAQAVRAEEALQQVAKQLENEERLAFVEDQLSTALAQYELRDQGRPYLAPIGLESEGAWIETLDSTTSLKAKDAYSLGDGDASLELIAEVVATIDFLAHKGELFSVEQAHDRGDEVDPPFYIYDYDYNESFAAAEASCLLRLTIQATYRAESANLEDLEVTDIQPVE